MSKNNQEKSIPTPEVAAQVKDLLEKIDHLEDFQSEEAQDLMNRYDELNEKYKLFDQIFEQDGKKGLRDITGKILVPAMYYDFPETYHYEAYRSYPVAAANKEGKYALVTTDGEGKPLTDFVYDDIHLNWATPYFITTQGKKIGMITNKGDVMIPCVLDDYTEPFNGVGAVIADGKEGIITDWGLYVEPIFEEVSEKDDYVYVRLGDKWGYVDFDGNFIDEKDEETLESADLLNYMPDFDDF